MLIIWRKDVIPFYKLLVYDVWHTHTSVSPLIKCILKREHTKTKAEREVEEAESAGVDVTGVTETEESLSFNGLKIYTTSTP